MDVCVHISCVADVQCLSALLYSMSAFAGLESCDLLVSLDSPSLETRLLEVCSLYPVKSVSVDAFDPSPRHPSRRRWRATRHGEGLNRLIRRSTSRLVMLVDPDVLILSPRWRMFCESAVAAGAFAVGTPYHHKKARTLWQGVFPNAWCSVTDGRELRRSGADMRPDFRRPKGLAPAAWAPPGGFGGRLHDCSWELARHAASKGLPHVSFEFSSGKLSQSLGGDVGDALVRLSPGEFSLPDGEVCCLHLMQAKRRKRTEEWLSEAWGIVDACLAREKGRPEGGPSL